jgi:DNA polymerase-3 subunit alpha
MYTPLSVHTHYSLLKAFAKSEELAESAANLGLTSVAITDYSLSGSVDFFSEMKDKKIKPIIGLKVMVCGGSSKFYVTLIAQNVQGWLELVTVSTDSHHNNLEIPEISFGTICNLKNIIVILHSVGGVEESIIENQEVYFNQDPSKYLNYFLNSDYENRIDRILQSFKSNFGERLFVGINRLNQNVIKIDEILNNLLSSKARSLQIKCVALSNVHYTHVGENEYHQLLMSSGLRIGLEKLKNNLDTKELAKYKRFFLDDRNVNGELMSFDTFKQFYTEEEIANTRLVDDMCESYNILNKPSLPKFPCPNGQTEDAHLLQMCREGWSKIKDGIDKDKWEEYGDRVRMELGVFQEVNLQGYFLIVADYVNWARKQGMLIGPGRGSASGCLVSYLLGITSIDPIPYDLYFERFYNAGRNSPGKVAYPDIDVDFPISGRESVIQYIRDTYGHDKVCQVATFGRLMGRGALKEIFRAYSAVPQELAHAISKKLPQESEIADKLEETQEKSIINYVLKYDPGLISDWCTRDDKGFYHGELGNYFALASHVEGTIKSYGKHASAVIISDKVIGHHCPMIPDKSTGEPIAGIGYTDMEKLGFVKMDVLGLKTLDMLMCVKDLLRTGRSNIKLNTKETNEDD